MCVLLGVFCFVKVLSGFWVVVLKRNLLKEGRLQRGFFFICVCLYFFYLFLNDEIIPIFRLSFFYKAKCVLLVES